jgi:hypothetical protein
MVVVVALMLTAAVIGAGTAFAQTSVVPATTIAEQPDDQSKVDPKDGEAPKAEKPEVAAPKAEKPEVAAPKAEKPKVAAPKAQKPEVAAPKAEKPEVAAPKAEKLGKPREEKPAPESRKPAQPTPAQPKAEPKRAQAGAPSVQTTAPGPEPPGDVAKPVSPRPKLAVSVAASGIGQVTTSRGPAGKQNRTAARRRANAARPEQSATSSASSGGESADAASAASGPAAVGPTRAPRVASNGVAAEAGAPLDALRPRESILGAAPGYNVVTPLLLAIMYAAGVGYLLRRELRRGLGFRARRPASARRGALPRAAARGRERLDRQFQRRLLRTRSSPPGAPRSDPAPLLALRRSSSRAVTVAVRALGSRRVNRPDRRRLVLSPDSYSPATNLASRSLGPPSRSRSRRRYRRRQVQVVPGR